MTLHTRKVAVPILDKLIALDQQTSRAYYEMGMLLNALSDGRLYELLGYNSFASLVESELSFSPATARTYMRMYRRFKELGYTKKEAYELLYEFGVTNVCSYLAEATSRVTMRTVRRRIEEIGMSRVQLNFTLDGYNRRLAESVLIRYGAKRMDGRLINSTAAFLKLLKEADKQTSPRRAAA